MDMRSDSRWTTRERTGVVLAIGGIVRTYALSAHLWVDMVDEGYFLELGQRVVDGALPLTVELTTSFAAGVTAGAHAVSNNALTLSDRTE